jgi:hypothetical protein
MLELRVWLSFLLIALIAAALLAVPGQAQVLKSSGREGLAALVFSHAQRPEASGIEPLDDVRAVTPKSLQDGWEAFSLGVGAGAEWQAWIDTRSQKVAFAEGGNVPWIPGHGNSLTMQDLDGFLKAKPEGQRDRIDLAVLDSIARSYLPRVSGMLGVDPAQLALNPGRSGQVASYLWFVDYDVVREGLPVEGARVVFRVNNGNLIQFGSENLPSAGAAVPPTRLTKRQAKAAVASYIGGFQAKDTFRDAGSLHLALDARSGGLVKAWQLTFQRAGERGTWQARVDATTGEVIELIDVNDYAQVTGSVNLISGPLALRPLPYADLSSGGFTNSAGLYTYPFTPVTSTLQGKYVQVYSYCDLTAHPRISQVSAASGTGDIDFGISTGLADCAPSSTGGGVDNTQAARQQYYQINRIMEVARGWMPTNTWLSHPLTVEVDETPSSYTSSYCEPYWNGQWLEFSGTGYGCVNPGWLADMGFHEFGHALDANDGTTYNDGGTTESYGDTTALIATHNSCIGSGLLLSGTCTGYGDACTACTGARDVDWNQHASHTAATPDNFTRVNCPIVYDVGRYGPCGAEAHCESYVPTEAIWDFASRDLPAAGTSPAWATLDRLWYLSRSTATKAFNCSGNTSALASDGCGAGTLWSVFRAADDDDGNLSNGTPHGGAIFNAFNRHKIACPRETGATTTFAGCAPPATPVLTAAAGDNSVALSWTGSHNAYDVFRNETGCNTGFARIGSGGFLSLTDGEVADGTTYYYQVTAYPKGNEACASAPSNCVAVTPAPPACVPPAAPASLTASTPATGGVALSWPAVAGASQYFILRATVSGGPYTQIDSVGGTSYTDFTGPSTLVYYVVRAATSHATCQSAYSPQASATRVPDFSLTIGPNWGAIPYNQPSTSFTIFVHRTGGFAGAVNLAVTGLPATVSATFSQNPGLINPVTMTVTGTASFAETLFTVTGTSGPLVRTATATLYTYH